MAGSQTQIIWLFDHSLLRAQIRSLGEGGFAMVDLCTLRGANGEKDMEVAVKHLKRELFAHGSDLEDFVKEGVLLSYLRHP